MPDASDVSHHPFSRTTLLFFSFFPLYMRDHEAQLSMTCWTICLGPAARSLCEYLVRALYRAIAESTHLRQNGLVHFVIPDRELQSSKWTFVLVGKLGWKDLADVYVLPWRIERDFTVIQFRLHDLLRL